MTRGASCSTCGVQQNEYAPLERTMEYGDQLIKLVGLYYPNKETIEATLQVTEACSLNCSYCVPAGTMITMSDYSLKPIEEIKLGDKVLAFNECTNEGKQRVLKESVVEQLFNREIDINTDKLFKISFEKGNELIITANHKVLEVGNRWRKPINFSIGDALSTFTNHYSFEDDTDEYKMGYLVGIWIGDGSYKHYTDINGYDQFKIRLALKDTEALDYTYEIMKDTFNIYRKPFLVSEKENLYCNAIFSNQRQTFHKIENIINTFFNKELTKDEMRGFMAGIYDTEGHIDKVSNTISITNTDSKILDTFEKCLKYFKLDYVKALTSSGTNKPVYIIRLKNKNKRDSTAIKFISICNNKILRKRPNYIGHSMIVRDKIKNVQEVTAPITVYNIGTTERTYIANGVCVHNCYEHSKSSKVMPLEVGKKFLEDLFTAYKDTHFAVVIDFIGGEPLLQPKLISELVDYWYYLCFIHMNEVPWYKYLRFSICSNGTEWDKPEVQKLIKRLGNRLSFTVSIDGNKELHDSARVHFDGSGSYDEAVHAATEYERLTGIELGSKMTIAPSNIIFLYPAFKHYLDSGATHIHANPVYEKGWTIEDAQLYYKELKRLADYKIENYPNTYLSIFNENLYQPETEFDTQTFCGGTGRMIACDPDGIYYPCIRFTPSAVGKNKDYYLTCGDITHGIDTTLLFDMKNSITRRSYSTDKCYYCPISRGCGNCAGYALEVNGTVDSRTTYHCPLHIAAALANVYYWNKIYKKFNIDKKFINYVPRDWALEIISEEELELLNSL